MSDIKIIVLMTDVSFRIALWDVDFFLQCILGNYKDNKYYPGDDDYYLELLC